MIPELPFRLVDLVANAVTHGEAAQPITVRTEGAPDGCKVSVHNHGQPIPPQMRAKAAALMVRR